MLFRNMYLQALSVLLLTLCTILATSCARDADEDANSYRIGVSQCSDDAWRTKLNEEMRRELLFHPNITLEVRSADDDNARQAEDIDYFINEHVDLLVVSPNEAAILTPAVSKAYDAGIPVIVADRKVTGEKYTAFIGGDNLAVGQLMGQSVLMMLPEGGKVIEIMGLPGSTPAVLRHEGFIKALGDKANRYEIVQGIGNWFQDQAETIAEQMLRQHPDTRMILGQNDLMAIGARKAADRILPGHDIIFMGVDGLTGPGNGVEAITLGLIEASAVYATGGDLIIQTAVKILNGEPFERNTSLNTYLIDPITAPLMDNIYKEVDHEVNTVMMLKGRVDYFWQQHNLELALLYTLLSFLLIVIIFIILLYRQYYAKKRVNESLARQQKTLKEQRDQLREQRDQLETQNEQLRILSEQLEEATKAKLMFFTNVSHDFRTPLTLINGPIEQLMHKAEQEGLQPDTDIHQLLRLAHKNVQVLLRLVNQILDFRKYESGKLELNLQAIDMKEEVLGWYDSFRGLAYKKHIHLELKTPSVTDDDSSPASSDSTNLGNTDSSKPASSDSTNLDNTDSSKPGNTPSASATHVNATSFQTMGDLAKLERIFFNLMGNAFKFTPENGHITVSLSATQEQILLQIADTGPGINVEHIQKIFENFYQIDSAHHEGSGIGLALVKNFVELHGGVIEVENQPVGTGTIFTVKLPIRPLTESLAEAEQRRANALTPAQVETELAEVIEPQELAEDDPKPAILVIDDNADIRQYLCQLLSPLYHVFTAADGNEGIRKAMRLVPNVILCDVMMPGIDGMETCRRLKAEVNTCHIPVVMLTACNLDEQRVQGHQEGADAYISKPFSSEVLMAQLEALIKSHDRVRDFFSDAVSLGKAILPASATSGTSAGSSPANPLSRESQSVISSIDDKFLQRLRSLIDKNLSDSEFGVEQLGDIIGMSRAQLYRKCKALTNYSPVELIRNTRLKRAQMLLAQTDDTIAQVAYAVGFTAPSYFTKCYKEYFGENPGELVSRKK